MSNCEVYAIRAITNMHVGSGDINFNIIDNEVQRDILTQYPTINSSSLKGAIREFFEEKAEEEVVYEDLIKKVFGDKEEGAGTYKFFSAMLLSMPVRSNKQQFFRGICPQIVKDFLSFTDSFLVEFKGRENLELILKLNLEENTPLIFKEVDDVKIEGYKAEVYKNISIDKLKALEKLFGENIAVFSDDNFKKIINELPVIARNKLKNGESKNLWYEEIIPRETRFYFGVLKGKEYNKEFSKMLTENIIQIGANASIGYGYTKIGKIVGEADE